MTPSQRWKNGQYCTLNGGRALPTLQSRIELRVINGICWVSGPADGGQPSTPWWLSLL